MPLTFAPPLSGALCTGVPERQLGRHLVGFGSVNRKPVNQNFFG